MAIVFTVATLLLGAANTALIGCYHVFLALVRLGYMPQWLAERNQRYERLTARSSFPSRCRWPWSS